MKLRENVTDNIGLKGLSIALAVSLWLFVTAGREREASFQAPLLLENVPRGLVADGPLPSIVDVRIRGSYILLAKVRAERPVINLDLSKAMAGKTEFPDLIPLLDLPDGVAVTRVSPASITVTLSPDGAMGVGR